MEEEKPRKSHAATWVCSVLAIVLLYVLSSGPTMKTRYLAMDPQTWTSCYGPLLRFANMTGTDEWLGWYLNWWEGPTP